MYNHKAFFSDFLCFLTYHTLRLYETVLIMGYILYMDFMQHVALDNDYLAIFWLLNFKRVISSFAKGWTDFKSYCMQLRLNCSDHLLEPVQSERRQLSFTFDSYWMLELIKFFYNKPFIF